MANIIGTDSSDILDGTDETDSIRGGDGNDTIRGFGGNDTLNGEGGNDNIDGGSGNDQIFADAADSVDGGSGDDVVTFNFSYVGSGNFSGGGGSDTIEFNSAVFDGNSGGALFSGFEYIARSSNLSGTEGNDAISFSSLSNLAADNTVGLRIDGLGGNDSIIGSGGPDLLIGGAGDDVLQGRDGADQIFAEGADTIDGGDGDDIVTFNFSYVGSGSFSGGGGSDTIEFNSANFDGSSGSTTFSGFEFIARSSNLSGTDNDDAINFSSLTNLSPDNTVGLRIDGLGGNDSIIGSGGPDLLIGGAGDDVLQGRGGADQIFAEGADTIDGGDGDDIVTFNLTYIGSGIFSGGEGTDTIKFNDAVFDGNSGGAVFSGFEYIAIASDVFGTDGDDVINLSGLNDLAPDNAFGVDIVLGAGNDQASGTSANDSLVGGDGRDTLQGNRGNDAISGGSNVDTAIFSGSLASYSIVQTRVGRFEIAGPDGTDSLIEVEFAAFADAVVRLLPGTGVAVNFETSDPSEYQSAMDAIRDFDGNVLGGDGNWLLIGSFDINGDGDLDQVLVNDAIGRFATVGTADDGLVYFDDHGWAGETRVAGIYIDPLVQSGDVEQGGPFDSQRRFQNDLEIENINEVLGSNDYDGDGIWEVYFALTDGTAYLRALMHADGNIRYANYQSEQEVRDYLTANGFGEETFGTWFGGSGDTGLGAVAVAPSGIGMMLQPQDMGILAEVYG